MGPLPEPGGVKDARIGKRVAQQFTHVRTQVGSLLIQRCGLMTAKGRAYATLPIMFTGKVVGSQRESDVK